QWTGPEPTLQALIRQEEPKEPFTTQYELIIRAKDQADAFAMGCDVVESIKKRFDREGVEIPFPHRTLVQKQAST
ncbi:MAG: mechanosensitive ion channel family protein, partial [Bacteroidota bacterium]